METTRTVHVRCTEDFGSYQDGENSSDDNNSIASAASLRRRDVIATDGKYKGSDVPQSIDDVPWFHKGMSRNASEAILLTNAFEGSYLLRDSSTNPGQYTISVRYSNSVKHFTMTYDGSIYKFGIGQFYSLEELLDHFACLPVLGTETGGTVTLKYPYYNFVPEPSAYERIERHAEGGRSLSFSNPLMSGPVPDYHIASKEGYLVKLGAIRKNWKKRWFVLKKGELKYFKTKESAKAIRTINLEHAIDISEEDMPGKLNCFSLQLPWRTFHFYAATARDAGDWMYMLKWKLEYYNKRNGKVSDDPLASMAR